MKRPARLSATFVRTVTEPGRYGDGRGAFGLSLLVKPTSAGRVSRTWAQRLRLDGRPFNIGLGGYPLVALAEARETALNNARAVRAGVDLLTEKRRTSAMPTFQEAAERVVELHAPTWRNGKTAAIWRARLAEYAYPVIGNVKVDALTTADILRVVTPIWAEKRETARKVRQYISAVMAWSIGQGFRVDNPAGSDVISGALPKAGAKTTHRRALPFVDVPAALAKVRESNAGPTTKQAVEFLTLTACRSAEVRGATWDEIDQDAAMWTIPAARMKGARAHRVPLSDAALAVLERAKGYADGSNLLFPSPTGRVLSDNVLSKLFRELGVEGTPHGMRSSFRDWAAECSGVPREIAELALAHVEGSASELAYRRTDFFERRRQLMEDWGEACT